MWESSDQVCGDWGECGRVQIKCVETGESVGEFRSSVWRLSRVWERTDQVCGDWGECESADQVSGDCEVCEH